jgi:endonuclease G
MRFILFTLGFLLSSIIVANPIDDSCPQFALRGAPISSVPDNQVYYLCKQNYAIQYNINTKTAVYVLEHITIESITGPAKRKDDFRPDPAIKAEHSAQLIDYAGQPYDRGHLAPAGDNTQNDSIMSESFFLSNMVPQVPNNNRGIWKQLETKVRNYVSAGNELYVVSGPIYDAGFQSIGKNVGIPTRLYKVVVDRKNQKASAYIFPNTALPVADMEKYKVSIQEVESASKINFHPQLPSNFIFIEQKKDW